MTTERSVTSIAISGIVAATVLGVQWMNITVKRPPPEVSVDTVYSITHDTVTVIDRAKDTMRVVVREVGPLTEQLVARMVCRDLVYGDKRDTFGYNALGMVFCPKAPKD